MSLRTTEARLTRVVLLFVAAAASASLAWAQDPGSTEKADASVQDKPGPKKTFAEAMDLLRGDAGRWDGEVTMWLRPGTDPIRSRAVVTAQLTLDGMYLEQRIEGKFGPELGNRSWTSLSFTGYNESTGLYETVRMASSNSSMIVVRGREVADSAGGTSLELKGEYTIMGVRALERDVLRQPGPDKRVIESWMAFDGSPEYKGMEMVLTRAPVSAATTPPEKEDAPMQLGNFSVSLAVKDLAVSRAFYEKLGFRKFGGDEKSWLILQNETCTIGLFQGMFDANILTFNPGWDRNGETLAEFEDVREIQKKLVAQGLTMTVPADESTSGPASLVLVDPDGNQILVDQHVPRPKK